MFAPVEPVPAQSPYTGLVASSTTPNDGARWQQGMAWRQLRCPAARGFDACGNSDGFEDPAVGTGDSSIAYYRPIAFRVEEECTTRSANGDDLTRVRNQALAVTSFMVARELETGSLTQAQPYDTPEATGQTNAYLASTDATVVAGTWDPEAGLGALEQAARQGSLGMDVFLHIPVRLVTALGDHLIQEGNRLRTRTGAVVVADAGYTGVGAPVAGTAEVQTVTITGGPTGGTFTLTYSGQTTAAIAFNAPAATVAAALNALSNLDGVAVTGAAGGPYTVTFPVSMGNAAQMTGDGSALTGGTTPAVAVATTTPGVAPSVTPGLWIRATGPTQVRLSDVLASTIVDHRQNTVLNVADRLFAATFDPCTLHALQVTDPAPTP